MEELRNKLKVDYIDYEEGKKIRKQLHDYADANYEQISSDSEHINFMERHETTFRINHPQDRVRRYYYTMFTCLTQHITGDTVRECLDKALQIEYNLNHKI